MKAKACKLKTTWDMIGSVVRVRYAGGYMCFPSKRSAEVFLRRSFDKRAAEAFLRRVKKLRPNEPAYVVKQARR